MGCSARADELVSSGTQARWGALAGTAGSGTIAFPALWEAAVYVSDVPRYIVPAPSANRPPSFVNHCFGPTDKVDSANRAGLGAEPTTVQMVGVFMEPEAKLARLPE